MTKLRACALGLAAALLVAVCLPPASARHRETYTVYARLSCYTDTGITYSGTYTTLGRTAGASWDIPLFSTVILPDGATRTIEDRGNTPPGITWIDTYCQAPLAFEAQYGDWGYVTVVEPE